MIIYVWPNVKQEEKIDTAFRIKEEPSSPSDQHPQSSCQTQNSQFSSTINLPKESTLSAPMSPVPTSKQITYPDPFYPPIPLSYMNLLQDIIRDPSITVDRTQGTSVPEDNTHLIEGTTDPANIGHHSFYGNNFVRDITTDIVSQEHVSENTSIPQNQEPNANYIMPASNSDVHARNTCNVDSRELIMAQQSFKLSFTCKMYPYNSSHDPVTESSDCASSNVPSEELETHLLDNHCYNMSKRKISLPGGFHKDEIPNIPSIPTVQSIPSILNIPNINRVDSSQNKNSSNLKEDQRKKPKIGSTISAVTSTHKTKSYYMRSYMENLAKQMGLNAHQTQKKLKQTKMDRDMILHFGCQSKGYFHPSEADSIGCKSKSYLHPSGIDSTNLTSMQGFYLPNNGLESAFDANYNHSLTEPPKLISSKDFQRKRPYPHDNVPMSASSNQKIPVSWSSMSANPSYLRRGKLSRIASLVDPIMMDRMQKLAKIPDFTVKSECLPNVSGALVTWDTMDVWQRQYPLKSFQVFVVSLNYDVDGNEQKIGPTLFRSLVALSLPMRLPVQKLRPGFLYQFAVRGIDVYGNTGPVSRFSRKKKFV